jgi:hypothetical protein
MTRDPISTVIGVFPDYNQANRAIDELRRIQFSYDRIRLVQHGPGNFFDSLKGMFTGQASMTSNTADVLTKMGMPEYEGQHYQQELDANHVLLLMNADDRSEEAFSIMRQNGAFDINSRFRTVPSNGPVETHNSNGSQETPHHTMPPTTAQPDVPPSLSNPDTSSTAPSPDVPLSTSHTHASLSTFHPDIPRETPRNA